MDWQTRITINPNILIGKPIIRGTRLAVEFIIDLLAQGWSVDEILRNYPGITLEDIQACLKLGIILFRITSPSSAVVAQKVTTAIVPRDGQVIAA